MPAGTICTAIGLPTGPRSRSTTSRCTHPCVATPSIATIWSSGRMPARSAGLCGSTAVTWNVSFGAIDRDPDPAPAVARGTLVARQIGRRVSREAVETPRHPGRDRLFQRPGRQRRELRRRPAGRGKEGLDRRRPAGRIGFRRSRIGNEAAIVVGQRDRAACDHLSDRELAVELRQPGRPGDRDAAGRYRLKIIRSDIVEHLRDEPAATRRGKAGARSGSSSRRGKLLRAAGGDAKKQNNSRGPSRYLPPVEPLQPSSHCHLLPRSDLRFSWADPGRILGSYIMPQLLSDQCRLCCALVKESCPSAPTPIHSLGPASMRPGWRGGAGRRTIDEPEHHPAADRVSLDQHRVDGVAER